jgi:hypothetical protein
MAKSLISDLELRNNIMAKYDENIIDHFINKLKTKTLDMAFLYDNNKCFMGMVDCPTFSLNPDNPLWLKDVREYVIHNYDGLVSGENFDYESIAKRKI